MDEWIQDQVINNYPAIELVLPKTFIDKLVEDWVFYQRSNGLSIEAIEQCWELKISKVPDTISREYFRYSFYKAKEYFSKKEWF